MKNVFKRLTQPFHRDKKTDAADIDNLSLKELLDLNHRICERIRKLSDKKMLDVMQNFHVGEQVNFKSEGNMVTGTVIKINKKTISVKTQEGYWNIAPQFLTKIK